MKKASSLKVTHKNICVRVPIELHERAEKSAKKGRYHLPISQLVIRGLELACDELEKQK